jgi:hypothetical protein
MGQLKVPDPPFCRLPDCSVITIQGSGHISLDARINLTDILSRWVTACPTARLHVEEQIDYCPGRIVDLRA